MTATSTVTLRTTALGGLPPLLLTWLLTRILMFAMLAIPAEHANFADIGTYAKWSTGAWNHGLLPGRDFGWEYPPGALLFLLLPVGNAGADSYFVAFLAETLVVDAVLTLLLHVWGRHGGSSAGAWLWVAALPLLGPVALTRYDVVPTALGAAGVAVAGALPALAGALLVFGASVKVWPVAVLALLLVVHRQPRRVALGASITATLLTVVTALTGVLPAATSTLHNQLARGSQVESLAALPFLWLRVLGGGADVTYRHSTWEVTGTGTRAVSLLLGLASLIAVLGLVRACWKRRSAGLSVDLAAAGAAAVGIALLGNKVFSPQYVLWLLGLLAVAACTAQNLDRLALPVAAAIAATTHLVYPLLYDRLLDGAVLPLALLTVRDALLVALCVVLVRPLRLRRPLPGAWP